MAQDIGMDRASSGPSVTLLSATLSDSNIAGPVPATGADFGDPTPLNCGFELILDCQASAADTATLIVVWSHDNSDYGVWASGQANGDIVCIVDCVASTDVKHVGEFPIKARYAKFYLQNDSGGDIAATSTSLVLWDAFGDIA